MNNRILELADSVVIENNSGEPLNIPDEFCEKFAELIIKECMVCCERVISDPVHKSVDTWLNGGSQCINEIKYHFGVES